MLAALAPHVAAGAAIIGLEPSCLLSLRDEFLVMRLGDDASRLAARAMLVEEFLAGEQRRGRLQLPLSRASAEARVAARALSSEGVRCGTVRCRRAEARAGPGRRRRRVELLRDGGKLRLRGIALRRIDADGGAVAAARGARCGSGHVDRRRRHELPAPDRRRYACHGPPRGVARRPGPGGCASEAGSFRQCAALAMFTEDTRSATELRPRPLAQTGSGVWRSEDREYPPDPSVRLNGSMTSSTCCFCAHLNPAGAKFCNECASPLHLKPCRACDAVNARDAQACYRCGAALQAAADVPEASPERIVAEADEMLAALKRELVAATARHAGCPFRIDSRRGRRSHCEQPCLGAGIAGARRRTFARGRNSAAGRSGRLACRSRRCGRGHAFRADIRPDLDTPFDPRSANGGPSVARAVWLSPLPSRWSCCRLRFM